MENICVYQVDIINLFYFLQKSKILSKIEIFLNNRKIFKNRKFYLRLVRKKVKKNREKEIFDKTLKCGTF